MRGRLRSDLRVQSDAALLRVLHDGQSPRVAAAGEQTVLSARAEVLLDERAGRRLALFDRRLDESAAAVNHNRLHRHARVGFRDGEDDRAARRRRRRASRGGLCWAVRRRERGEQCN